MRNYKILLPGMKSLKKREDCSPEELKRQEKVWKKRKGSASEKRKRAMKLNSIPRMGEEKLMKLVNEPQESAKVVMKLVEELTSRVDLPDKLKIELLGKVCLAHNSIHGIKSKNLNLNVGTTADIIIQRLRELKQEKAFEDAKVKEELKVIKSDFGVDSAKSMEEIYSEVQKEKPVEPVIYMPTNNEKCESDINHETDEEEYEDL